MKQKIAAPADLSIAAQFAGNVSDATPYDRTSPAHWHHIGTKPEMQPTRAHANIPGNKQKALCETRQGILIY
ncbi:MAG: hypothetical protein KDE19_07330 [Caldilineaceae bacterium]|nr:hypothetical protein [Caldilineaceae bacterium]